MRMSSSTRPVVSWSVARRGTQGSPAARSSWTPTAAWRVTAGGPSAARTPRRSTARPAMRWVAKNVVAAKLASRCEAQVAYAIGVAQPVSVMIDTFRTGVVPDEAIEDAVRDVFDLTPLGINKALNLRHPIYRATAAYGHFG